MVYYWNNALPVHCDFCKILPDATSAQEVLVEALRQMRLQKGWSQQDLAGESGVGQDTISGIESGRHEPRPSTLRKLAQALGVEVADFFRDPAAPLAGSR